MRKRRGREVERKKEERRLEVLQGRGRYQSRRDMVKLHFSCLQTNNLKKNVSLEFYMFPSKDHFIKLSHKFFPLKFLEI